MCHISWQIVPGSFRWQQLSQSNSFLQCESNCASINASFSSSLGIVIHLKYQHVF